MRARFLFVFLLASFTPCLGQTAPKIPDAEGPRVLATALQIPLHFEANQGQVNDRVSFLSRGQGYTLFLTPGEAVLSLRRPSQADPATDVVRLRLLNANPDPQAVGADAQPGVSNYFLGNDPSKWRANVSHYAKVQYQGVYPGVDLVYYGTDQRTLEHDFIVAPGADPRVIRFEADGADSLRLGSDGNLIMYTSGGEVILKAPVTYQEVGGVRRSVESRYVVEDFRVISFALGAYDNALPVVIDPILTYSSYLGGSGYEDGLDIAVDGSGNAYMAGLTQSTDFPTSSAYDGTLGGTHDLFVTKLNAAGSALVWSTYIGGSGVDYAIGIAVDGSDNVYLTGPTASTDFPTVGAYQGTHGGGGNDIFVTKLNAAGSALVYSTYIGGSDSDGSSDIAVDGSGNAYITGNAPGANFPTVSPYQAANGGGGDAFVTKLNAAGSALTYSTYLGGTGLEVGNGIAVDGSGNAYVTGYTQSTDFPTSSPFQASHGGGSNDIYVTKLNAAGSALVYSTYLGGSNGEQNRAGSSIAVDGSGNVYLTGNTQSTDFPTSSPYQASNGGGYDAFVTKFNAAGSALTYSTYLGDTGTDDGYGIAVDGSGNAHITAQTYSTNFPTVSPYQATYGGAGDIAYIILNAAGSALTYSTFLGGSALETGKGIVVDASGGAYIVGQNAAGFPTANAYQPSFGGGGTMPLW